MERADLVVVGGGTIGGWASTFAAAEGAGRVVLLERDLVGQGASSRAAGVVRAQGGTRPTVALGRWTIDFYRRQAPLLGTDSGFRELGYMVLAATAEAERDAHERVAMQQAQGLAARWISVEEAVALNPTLSGQGFRGATYAATDGCIDPPRNVRAYTVAMHVANVAVRERTAFLGLRTEAGSGDARRVIGVETSAGPIETRRVLLTGGPTLRDVGRAAGLRIWVGGARHTVAVLEPHEAFAVERLPMAFDIAAGLYWRLEEGGLLFGFSDPEEAPGAARAIDFAYLERMRGRLAEMVPVTRGLGLRKVWAATIDYTTDHLPILGPAISPDGGPIEGCWVAAAAGHGMMWGPGVARAATDLVLRGATDLLDVADLGMDRFDARGRSRLAPDPIALPYPIEAEDEVPAGR